MQGKSPAEDQATVTREELEKGQVPAAIASGAMSYDGDGNGLDENELLAFLNAQAAARTNFTIYDTSGRPVVVIQEGAITVSEMPDPPAAEGSPADDPTDSPPPQGTPVPAERESSERTSDVVRPRGKWEQLIAFARGEVRFPIIGNIVGVTDEAPERMSERFDKKYDKDNDGKVSERELVRLLRDLGYEGANRKVVEALFGDYDGILESDDTISLEDVYKVLSGKAKDLALEGKAFSVWITLRLEKVDTPETATWVRAQYEAGDSGTLQSAFDSDYGKKVLDLADLRFKMEHSEAKEEDYKKSDEYWQYVTTFLMDRLFEVAKETYRNPIDLIIFKRIRWDNELLIQEFVSNTNTADGKALLARFVETENLPKGKELLYLMRVSHGTKKVDVRPKPEPQPKDETGLTVPGSGAQSPAGAPNPAEPTAPPAEAPSPAEPATPPEIPPASVPEE
jgi:hypothetical protein